MSPFILPPFCATYLTLSVTVHVDERVVLRFKDGKEIETRL